jgi:PAS domain S-box-containing protein
MIIDKQEYTILVVEDNPGDLVLVEDYLYENFTAPKLHLAENFSEAKTKLLVTDLNIDVVLLDLSLPDKTGEPLICEIVALCVNIPVIVLTGYTDFSFGLKSLSLGVADYMLKDELTSMSLYKSIIYSIERKKNSIALQETEKRYSNLFHLSPLPMWVVDMSTLQFIDVNNATIVNYGYTKEELLSMTLKDIRPEEEVAALLSNIEKVKQYPDANYEKNMIHRTKTGELRNVMIRATRIKYGNKDAALTVAADITDQLNYIKTIERQNESLREISWIQSHIVRAPLSRIMGLVQLIEAADDVNDETKQVLQYLSEAADELDNVIREITNKSQQAE